jgi:hypothetical protein
MIEKAGITELQAKNIVAKRPFDDWEGVLCTFQPTSASINHSNSINATSGVF